MSDLPTRRRAWRDRVARRFGEIVRAARAAKGWSVLEACRISGGLVRDAAWRAVEDGSVSPKLDVVLAICRTLRLDPAEALADLDS